MFVERITRERPTVSIVLTVSAVIMLLFTGGMLLQGSLAWLVVGLIGVVVACSVAIVQLASGSVRTGTLILYAVAPLTVLALPVFVMLLLAAYLADQHLKARRPPIPHL
ncbi:MAG: hypothetical protein ACRDK3_06695 [Actinomycetota bacterium]